MFDFASLNLGKVETLVDVGAGTGAFLGPAIDFYQPARVIAVEMLPERAAYLRSRFSGPFPLYVLQAAVGERAATSVPIQRTLSADSSSLLYVTPESQRLFNIGPHAMDQFSYDRVPVFTLDSIWEAYPEAGQVDLMKMDIQGYEGRAIRGGQQTLRRTRALIIEVLFCHHYEGQSTEHEIDRLLRNLGFRFDRWLTDDWNADHTVHLQGDAFYRRDL